MVEKDEFKVTATVSTRNRYDTTLPLCLHAIASQTRPPDELIIYDDGEHRDLRTNPIYQNIFSMLNGRGIEWKVEFAKGEGQVKNHQKALEEAKGDLIWRLDDDNVPDNDVLEGLIECMNSNIPYKVGAVGGLVIDPKQGLRVNRAASSAIEDIYLGLNEQWFLHPDGQTFPVDHLYSTFLYRKEAGKHGYDKDLSRVGHREETIFTYEMKRAGYMLLVNPRVITWHYHSPTGGIRDNTKEEMWKWDEKIFSLYMKTWGVLSSHVFVAVLNNGLGDHYAFLSILPEIVAKMSENKLAKIIIACCAPAVFHGISGINLISIAEAQMFGDLSKYDIYRWMIDHNWRGSLVEAYRRMYL